MRPLPPRVSILACVGVLLAAGAGLSWSLRAPDPRTRAAWTSAPPIVRTGQPLTTTLYLPSCQVTAVRVHAAPGASGLLDASLTVDGRPLTPDATTRVVLAPGAPADIPLREAPPRRRATLTLATQARDVPLHATRPFELEAAQASALGLLPCALGVSEAAAWTIAAALVLHLVGLGYLAARVWRGRPATQRPARWPPALAAALTGTTVAIYAALVPPFEPPDEMAHLQYARFVATTGGLPRALPPDAQWRDSAYEWVQQPAYYVVAAGLLRAFGDPDARPAPRPHPESLLAGGPDMAIYQHPDTSSPPAARRGIVLLRALSLLLAMLTAWWTARAIGLVTGDVRLAVAAAACLSLVHQWAAVMGSVSTDPPATAAAAAATWLLCRYLHGPARWTSALGMGLAVGIAWAMKVTATFLVPMLAVALLVVATRDGWRLALRQGVACTAGVVLAAGWIPLRASLVFGDPLARAFKREVLALGGFVVLDRPPILSVAFADELRRLVFEPFWARFGSLGAGPLPGTRLWWVYGTATLVLVALASAGCSRAARDGVEALRRRELPAPAAASLIACAVGVAAGLALWAWINLVPQDDVIVHWTPRHILPLTAPLLVTTAAGVLALAARLPATRRHLLRPVAASAILLLAVAGLAVLRSVILQFHFGF